MYLFTRRIHVRAGELAEAMSWATGITEQAHQISGLDISLFSGVYGPQVGTLVWSSLVPDLATLEAATDKLNVDDGYLAAASKGQKFAPDGANDRLLQIVHPQLQADAAGEASPISYASVVSSVCGPGSFGRGMELGVEIALKVEQITGTPTLFAVDTTGNYGGVAWLSGYADAAAMQAAEGALAASPEFTAFIDREAAGVYSADPGATTQLLYRRII